MLANSLVEIANLSGYAISSLRTCRDKDKIWIKPFWTIRDTMEDDMEDEDEHLLLVQTVKNKKGEKYNLFLHWESEDKDVPSETIHYSSVEDLLKDTKLDAKYIKRTLKETNYGTQNVCFFIPQIINKKSNWCICSTLQTSIESTSSASSSTTSNFSPEHSSFREYYNNDEHVGNLDETNFDDDVIGSHEKGDNKRKRTSNKHDANSRPMAFVNIETNKVALFSESVSEVINKLGVSTTTFYDKMRENPNHIWIQPYWIVRDKFLNDKVDDVEFALMESNFKRLQKFDLFLSVPDAPLQLFESVKDLSKVIGVNYDALKKRLIRNKYNNEEIEIVKDATIDGKSHSGCKLITKVHTD